MPISTNALHYHAMLFDLGKLITMLPKIFDDLVYGLCKASIVQYAFRNTSEKQKVKYSTTQDADAHFCNRSLRPVDGTAVIIGHLDEAYPSIHTHDIEKSFCQG